MNARRVGRPFVGLVLLLLACGGGGGSASAPDAPAPAPERAADAGPAADASVPTPTPDAAVPPAPPADAMAPPPDMAPVSPPPQPDAAAQPPPMPDAAAQPPSYLGLWRGTSSQGLPITIAIDVAGIRELEYGWAVPACSSTTRTSFGAAIPIADGAFTRLIAGGPGGVRTEITGRFVSNTSLSGTLMFTVIPIPGQPSCSGTAQATYTASPM